MTEIKNLPETLRKTAKFCCWRYEHTEDGRQTKRPYNPVTGAWAKVNNPDTFTDIHTATAALSKDGGYYYAGIGAGIFGNLAGIDIDHCIDRDTGYITTMASDIMEIMDGAYMEKSPSKKGLRILFTVPDSYIYDNVNYYIKRSEIGLECYVSRNIDNKKDHHRYLTLTGDTLTPGVDLSEVNPEALNRVLNKYMQRPKKTAEPLAPSAPLDISDNELLEKARNNSLFCQLYDRGDITGYPSQSEADEALCGMLAYWTQRDPVKMDTLFRQSALMRPKWTDHNCAYRDRTINRAIENCVNVYDPNYRSAPEWTKEDSEGLKRMRERIAAERKEATNDDPDEWDEMIFSWDDEPTEEKPAGNDLNGHTTAEDNTGDNMTGSDAETVKNDSEASEAVPVDPKPHNTADYLKNRFSRDRENFRSDIKTGFSNLDKLLNGLYSGLYVLAATSSLGKTTFCIQLADQLAGAGNDVLYFSLEQSRFDLVCKSLSRIMGSQALADGEPLNKYPSETDIKQGKQPWLTEQAQGTYINTMGDRLSVIEGNFNYGLKNIKEYTTAYMDANGVKPVVIVDYLQIISPNYEGERRPLREAIDMIVSELKRFSRDNNLTIILISSVNRASYTEAIDFDSLKESGSIEFTADVVIGLQYAVISEKRDLFEDPKKSKAEKQRALDIARRQTPAVIEARILKNRFGESRTSCKFDYYMTNALFVPTDEYSRVGNEDTYTGDAYNDLEIG